MQGNRQGFICLTGMEAYHDVRTPVSGTAPRRQAFNHRSHSGDDGLTKKSDRAHIWVWAQNFQESLFTHKTTSEPTVRKSVVE